MQSNLISYRASKRDSNVTYNVIKQQLEAQKELLMEQRKNLSKKISPELQNIQTDRSSLISSNNEEGRGRNSSKANAIKEKIKDILQICGANGYNSADMQYQEIVEAEEQILSHLNRMENKRASNDDPNLNTVHQISKITVREDSKGFKEDEQRKGLRASIGDDAMEMIQAIETKALVEIENLRISKVNLMKKLNAEIRGHNEEKKKVIFLENQIKNLMQQIQKMGIKYQKRNYQEQKKSKMLPVQNTQDHFLKVDENSNYNLQRVSPINIKLEANPQQQQKKRPMQPSVISQPPQQYFETEIQRLSLENKKMKTALSENNGQALKQKLKQEIMDLNRKILGYESLLKNNPPRNSTPIENLLAEGDYLSSDAQNLIMAKSNSRPGSKGPKTEEFFREVNFLKNRISELEKQNSTYMQTNQNVQNTRESLPAFKNSTYTPRAGRTRSSFQPSKYEGLINEMKRAAFN